jgi:hypothetical protein
MEEDIDKMMKAGLVAEEPAIEHMRKPGKGMPVGGVVGREGPFDALPGRALLDNRIYILVIIITYKFEIAHRQIYDKSYDAQKDA